MGGPAEGSGKGGHLQPDAVPFGHFVHPELPLPGQAGPGLGQLLPELVHLLPHLPGHPFRNGPGKEPAGF